MPATQRAFLRPLPKAKFFIFYFAVGQFFIDLYFAVRQYEVASEEEGGEAKAYGPSVVSLPKIGDPPGGREGEKHGSG